MNDDKSLFTSNHGNVYDIVSNIDRTNDNKPNAEGNYMDRKSNEEMDIGNCKNNINIYRYKFTNEFIEELYKFSKIHQYDSRSDFKEAWEVWIENNNDLVQDEIRRLQNLDYQGNIIDKMYKSARYYFRKKIDVKEQAQVRRKYIPVQKDLISCMDNHIKVNILLDNFKPSNGFITFCQSHIELLKEEITRLETMNITDIETIKNKIKKTYKNRYFTIIKK